jgi:formylglycine-generating enzyme required for sulfatase activity
MPMAVSCMGSTPSCGPAGTTDCCNPLPIPGGTFYRSYDLGTDAMYPTMTAPATVSGFWLDGYEVTVGRYRRFVMAGQGTQQNPPAAGAGGRTLNGMAGQAGWQAAWNTNLPADATAQLAELKCSATDQTWTDSPGANENLPISCISWYDAIAFCAWDGGFMPTEAEWNYAATGGDEQRAYPWSMPASALTIDCTHANYYNASAGYCTNPPNGAATPVGSRSPIGDGRWGHADLSGNLWEWVLDLSAAYATPCDDCADLASGSSRVTRGGYFRNSLDNLRASNRSQSLGTDRFGYLGVRCARM